MAGNKLKKSEFVEIIMKELGNDEASKKDVENSLEAVSNAIKKVIKKGDEVVIPGVMTIKPKKSKAKSGTAPNGEKWSKPAEKTAAVKIAKPFKDFLNNRK